MAKQEIKEFDITAKVTMIGTGAKSSHPDGEEFVTHPNVGRKFFLNGWATYKNKADETDFDNVSPGQATAQPVTMTNAANEAETKGGKSK